MTEHAVVIAGGGPAGMMLAAELALAKVDRVHTLCVQSALGAPLDAVRVARTPDWRSMIPEDVEFLTAATLTGERLFRYPTAR